MCRLACGFGFRILNKCPLLFLIVRLLIDMVVCDGLMRVVRMFCPSKVVVTCHTTMGECAIRGSFLAFFPRACMVLAVLLFKHLILVSSNVDKQSKRGVNWIDSKFSQRKFTTNIIEKMII